MRPKRELRLRQHSYEARGNQIDFRVYLSVILSAGLLVNAALDCCGGNSSVALTMALIVATTQVLACWIDGAGDRDRTGDIQLGKLAFYR